MRFQNQHPSHRQNLPVRFQKPIAESQNHSEWLQYAEEVRVSLNSNPEYHSDITRAWRLCTTSAFQAGVISPKFGLNPILLAKRTVRFIHVVLYKKNVILWNIKLLQLCLICPYTIRIQIPLCHSQAIAIPTRILLACSVIWILLCLYHDSEFNAGKVQCARSGIWILLCRRHTPVVRTLWPACMVSMRSGV